MKLSFAEARRALRDAHSVPIEQIVADSRVKICGRVLVFRNTLEAPLSGRRCVWSRIVVGARFGRVWRRILDEEERVDFLLQDDSGTARDTIQHARALLLPDKYQTTGFMRRRLPLEISAMLNKLGVATSDRVLGGRSLRISESVLQIDHPAAALGTARFETIAKGVSSGYRRRPRRAVLHGDREEGIILAGALEYIDSKWPSCPSQRPTR